MPEAKDGKRTVVIDSDQPSVRIPGTLVHVLGGDALRLQFGQLDLKLNGESLKSLVGAGGDHSLEIQLNQGSEAETEEITTFPVPVELSMPVLADADPNLIGIYRITQDGELVYVGGKLRDGVLAVKVTEPGRYILLEYECSYRDVSDSHWAYRAICAASAKHLMNGLSDGTFVPYELMTRAQLAAIIARALIRSGLTIPCVGARKKSGRYGVHCARRRKREPSQVSLGR